VNFWSKKLVIGLVSGAVIMTGTIIPFAAQAAESNGVGGPGYGMHQRNCDSDKLARNLADTFGVTKEAVLKYQQQGVRMKDLKRASFLAKASGKSLEEVMAAKTFTNTWKDVAQVLGVTKENMKTTRQDITSGQLEKTLNISKKTSLELMQQGYHSRDIAVANELANNTGKSLSDILSMRRINNTWKDVAQNLGVGNDTYKQDLQAVRAAFPHKGMYRHQYDQNGNCF